MLIKSLYWDFFYLIPNCFNDNIVSTSKKGKFGYISFEKQLHKELITPDLPVGVSIFYW